MVRNLCILFDFAIWSKVTWNRRESKQFCEVLEKRWVYIYLVLGGGVLSNFFFFVCVCFLLSLPFHFAVKLGHSEILELTRRKQFNVQMTAYFGVKFNLIIMFFSQNNDHKSFFFLIIVISLHILYYIFLAYCKMFSGGRL